MNLDKLIATTLAALNITSSFTGSSHSKKSLASASSESDVVVHYSKRDTNTATINITSLSGDQIPKLKRSLTDEGLELTEENNLLTIRKGGGGGRGGSSRTGGGGKSSSGGGSSTSGGLSGDFLDKARTLYGHALKHNKNFTQIVESVYKFNKIEELYELKSITGGHTIAGVNRKQINELIERCPQADILTGQTNGTHETIIMNSVKRVIANVFHQPQFINENATYSVNDALWQLDNIDFNNKNLIHHLDNAAGNSDIKQTHKHLTMLIDQDEDMTPNQKVALKDKIKKADDILRSLHTAGDIVHYSAVEDAFNSLSDALSLTQITGDRPSKSPNPSFVKTAKGKGIIAGSVIGFCIATGLVVHFGEKLKNKLIN